jgi:transglutaminase-like putative cysteine protease
VTQRRHLTLVAAGATVLASLPLASVFERWSWLISSLLVVGAMTATAVLLRSVRAPGWAPTVGMIGAYIVTLTWLFSDGRALLGLVPTPATFERFNDLLVSAGVTIRESGVPVADEDGLLFLAAIGVGAVLLSVDLAAVVARRPAIAGIPMIAIYLVPVGTHTSSVSFLAFVCTAAAFLWLLATDNVDRVRRFGRRFTGDGRDIDVWEPSPLAAAGRRLAVIGVAVAVILPIAVPGMTTGLLDRFGTGVGDGLGTGSGQGRPGNVNLFSYLQGALVRERAYDMVKVTTNDTNPFYLRFAVAEDLNNNGFVNRPWSQGRSLSSIPQPPQAAGNGVSYKAHQAQVEILQFNEQVLPVFPQLTRVDRLDGSNNWLYDQRAGVVYSKRTNAKGRKYTFSFVHAEFTPDALRTARDLPAEDQVRQAYTAFPEATKQVKEIALDLVKGKTNPYDKVRAIYDFFSPDNGFSYSLTTVKGNSGSDMVDFISEGGRKGYCEQYAAAMAWMVRAVGIPSRVAFGWTKGTNRKDNTYTLTNFNLHAWTEVYFAGFGWVPFDATPASAVPGSVPSTWAPDLNQPDGPIVAPGPDDLRASAGASGGASAPATNQFGGNDAGLGGDSGSGDGSTRWPYYLLGGLLVALVLLLMPALHRASLRRRRWPGGKGGADGGNSGEGGGNGGGGAGNGGGGGDNGADPPPSVDPDGEGRELVGAASGHRRAKRDAHGAWDELVDTMIDYRVEIDPAETPRLTSDRLIADLYMSSDAATGVKTLSRAEERARYARSPLTDVDLATPLRDVRSALRYGVSRRTRLVAALLPPSVLARWRAGISARYAATITAVGKRRDVLARTISPRRLLATRTGR